MKLVRIEQLRQAHRHLELAELMADNGDHFAAADKVAEARTLIFGSKQAAPVKKQVAGPSPLTN